MQEPSLLDGSPVQVKGSKQYSGEQKKGYRGCAKNLPGTDTHSVEHTRESDGDEEIEKGEQKHENRLKQKQES